MSIPQELTALKQWVVAKPDKVPLNPRTGLKASVTEPLTWTDYATASGCVQSMPELKLVLGFVLTADDPFVCVDLDSHKTTDQTILDTHKAIYERLNSYSEKSPNGGVHIWVKGSLANGRKDSKRFIEVYPHSRFLTFTSNILNDVPIAERQEGIDWLLNTLPPDKPDAPPVESQPESQSDDEICRQAANASNGELFKDLWNGRWKERNYPSQSEADQALVNIIAFYCDNKQQCARIFHASELGKRPKAHRNDYLFHASYGIVTRAFDQKCPPINSELASFLAVIDPTKKVKRAVEGKKQIINSYPEPMNEDAFMV